MAGVIKLNPGVKELIRDINTLIERRSDTVKVIDNPNVLLDALLELDNLVEMDQVKHSIVEQIQLLIVLAYRATKSGQVGRRFDGHSLHTVFYGPPGVGKSKTAKCLARIWQGLGVLSDLQTVNGGAGLPRAVTIPDLTRVEKTQEKLADLRTHLQDLYSTYHPTSAGSPTRTSIFADTGKKRTIETVWTQTHPKWETALSLIKELSISKPAPSSAPPIVVCGREDLVAPFSGQTADKAKNFLMSNRGRCIIFEEAYSLCNGPEDGYGKEALVVLNRFMEEYGDQVVVIFTGYRKELMTNIFTIQPGLVRRCQSTFEVKGYTPAGLAAIFASQLREMHWTVDPAINLVEFFTEHYQDFPAFGGDTNRLAFHCKLRFGGSAFSSVVGAVETNTPVELEAVIHASTLNQAFQEYQRHRLTTP